MKYMTNAQIDEINALLEKHGVSLTAFYNEGMAQGAKNVIQGVLIGSGILIGIKVIKVIIKTLKEKKES